MKNILISVLDTFKKKNEKKTPTDNSKAGLENDIKVLEEDLKELRRKTSKNMCCVFLYL
ncbi:UNVERIFIED_CONTAM: hypothetical protein FKN15_075132 [Acipenser sinensis]